MAVELVSVYQIMDWFLDDDVNYLNAVTFLNNDLQLLGSFEIVLPREHVPKITNFAEIIIPQYTIDDFQVHFRIGRTVFQHLLGLVSPHLLRPMPGGTPQIQPEKMLLMFCWYIANMTTMRELANIFGVSKSTVFLVIKKMLNVFQHHLSHLISWPDNNQQQELARRTAQMHGVPGIIGYIDGTHITLPYCLEGDQDYINRKKYPSVILQVVVDRDMLIRHCYSGWPGCTHDARVLRNSALYTQADEGNLFIPDHYLVGDSAYPLKPWLMTVFRNNGHLTPEQQRFNRILSSLRQVVERAIGHLKGRFRKLREVHLHKIDMICQIIFAGCVLHNLCVIEEDNVEDYMDMDLVQRPNNYPGIYPNDHNAMEFRNNLMQQILL